MSLDKAIFYGKEHRKKYTGHKAYDKTCRNHGTCSLCESNRRYNEYKGIEAAKYELKQFNRWLGYVRALNIKYSFNYDILSLYLDLIR